MKETSGPSHPSPFQVYESSILGHGAHSFPAQNCRGRAQASLQRPATPLRAQGCSSLLLPGGAFLTGKGDLWGRTPQPPPSSPSGQPHRLTPEAPRIHLPALGTGSPPRNLSMCGGAASPAGRGPQPRALSAAIFQRNRAGDIKGVVGSRSDVLPKAGSYTQGLLRLLAAETGTLRVR